MYIRIYDITGENCVDREDGQTIYSAIFPELKEGNKIELDFTDVIIYASPFFNHAIGKLYKDFSQEEIKNHVNFTNMSTKGLKVLKLVTNNSKEYYSNETYRDALNEVLKKQEDGYYDK